jgi:hypothetical protein
VASPRVPLAVPPCDVPIYRHVPNRTSKTWRTQAPVAPIRQNLELGRECARLSD